jgi:hypothetical protein
MWGLSDRETTARLLAKFTSTAGGVAVAVVETWSPSPDGFLLRTLSGLLVVRSASRCP